MLFSRAFSKPGYTFLVSQKSRQTNPLQLPQQGPYEERGLSTGHFAYLSKTSSFRFPSKGALPLGPLWSSSQSDAPLLEPSFFHLSKSPVYETPTYQVPLGRKVAPTERDARIRRPSQHIFQGPQ